MNYQGIVNWLQEDGFVLMGFSNRGELTLMEKHTGRDVNDLSAFLIATVLPIAKKKVVHILEQGSDEKVRFEECAHPVQNTAYIYVGVEQVSAGSGATLEYAMVNAIENFIKKEQEISNDKG